jgi:DNA-binding XRE family transcriptional regulator
MLMFCSSERVYLLITTKHNCETKMLLETLDTFLEILYNSSYVAYPIISNRTSSRRLQMTEIRDFASCLRMARKQEHLSQEDLADRIGCSRIHLSRLENGHRFPSRILFSSLLRELPSLKEICDGEFERGYCDGEFERGYCNYKQYVDRLRSQVLNE